MKKIAFSGLSLASLLKAHQILSQSPQSELTLFVERKAQLQERQELAGCLLYPQGDFFAGVSPAVKEEIERYGVNLNWSTPPTAPYYVLKDGLLSPYPKNLRKIYTTSLLFITEKVKYYFALRKKYSLWPDISLAQATETIWGDNFSNYLVSPAARKQFFLEIEDIELGCVFPTITAEVNLKELLAKICLFEKPRLFPREGYDHLLHKLIEKLPVRQLRLVEEKVTRYKGQGRLLCGSREYHFDQVFFTHFQEQLFKKDFAELVEQAAVKRTSINSVYLVYEKRKVAPKGAGVLIPRKEKLPLLFVDYLSNWDSSRASKDLFLVRCVLAGDSDVFQESDLITFASETMRKILHNKEQPLFSQVFRNIRQSPLVSKGCYLLRQAIQKAQETDGHFVILTEEDTLL